MSGTQRRAKGIKRRDWYRELRDAMVAGLERCRMCGLSMSHESVLPGGLRVGHIRPWSVDQCQDRGNLTVVCGSCDHFMGANDWTGRIASLLDDDWTPPLPPAPLRRADALAAPLLVPAAVLARFGVQS